MGLNKHLPKDNIYGVEAAKRDLLHIFSSFQII